MLDTDWSLIKGIGSVIGVVLAFFYLKKIIKSEIDEALKLRMELVHAEIVRLKLEIERLEHLVDLKLPEREHTLLCEAMQKEVGSIKTCLKKEFEILHNRMNRRRVTNGDANAKVHPVG